MVDTSLGRVAMIVCYDVEFPEWTRMAGLGGADVLAVPTNWPLEARPPGERPMEVVRLQAAASANRMFVVAADRCGVERGVPWVGGSVILGPDGYPLAGPVAADREELLVAARRPARGADQDHQRAQPRAHRPPSGPLRPARRARRLNAPDAASPLRRLVIRASVPSRFALPLGRPPASRRCVVAVMVEGDVHLLEALVLLCVGGVAYVSWSAVGEVDVVGERGEQRARIQVLDCARR